MVDHFSTYLYQKRGFYYFSRRVPKEVQHCHSKQRIVFALNTRSRANALKYSQIICQRLDERWLPMRLDALGFGNVMTNDVRSLPSPKLSEATQQYIKLRGMGKAKTFHQTAIRIVDILKADGVAMADIIKIDIEGMEDRALFPYFEAISKDQYLKLIVMEDGINARWERYILGWLLENGYHAAARTRGNIMLELTP